MIGKPRVVLIAIVVITLGACAGKDKPTLAEQQQENMEALRQATLETVQETERAEQAALLVEELKSIMDAAAQDQQTFRESFQALNRDYAAKRVQFEKLFEDYNVAIEMHKKRALAVRQQLTEVLTAEEWVALAKVRKKALQSNLPFL